MTDKNDALFEVLSTKDAIAAVERAFIKVNSGTFVDLSLVNMFLSPQIICGIFHEIIVNEISTLPGWRPGAQKKEYDIVHESGIQLQVKTKSDPEGVAGNRYSNKSTYQDPSGYYLCVNFLPLDSICKVRMGWVESHWWKPQKGNGNASVIPKDKLNELVFLYGNYLKGMNLLAIDHIGEKTIRRLANEGILRLSDFFQADKYQKASAILSEKQMALIHDYLVHIV